MHYPAHEKWGAGSFFHSKQTKNIAALWKWLVWLLFLCLINPTQSQAQEPVDTFVQCGNVALTGSHPFIVGMDTVGMDTEHEVTRCSLKTSRLNQPSLSFSSLKNLGLYLYAVLSVASSGRYSLYAGVSTLKQPSLPLPGMPAPGFSSPALFSPGSTQPLNQKERVRPYLIPDNLSTDHIKKLNRAFRHIDQHGTEKPEKGTGVNIYTSFINHKIRQVITLPEHCLTQERTFDLLNHLLEASLNAWLTYYLSISDTPSLIRLIPVVIERAMVMSSGAGGDDWNNGGWITNELNDDTPFSIRIVPFSRTATQWMQEWMQQLITLDMKLKRKLIVLLYDQLHASVLSGNRDLARISRDRIMLIEVETGERLRRISDSGNSAVELSMQAEQLITEFLSYTEDVQRHRTLASRNDSHTHSGRRSSAIGLMVNEIERRLEQLSTSSDNNQEVIHQLDSALESLRLQLEHFIHDNDNPANNNKVVDGDRQPTENSNAGASSTYTASDTAASTSSGHSYRLPSQFRPGEGGGDGGGGRPPPRPPSRYLNSVTDTAISIVTNLEQNPERLTLDHLISLVEAHGEELLGTRSSNYPENSLLHIICLNKKTDIIEWINLNIRNDYRHTIYHAKNRKNVTPAILVRPKVKLNPNAPVFEPRVLHAKPLIPEIRPVKSLPQQDIVQLISNAYGELKKRNYEQSEKTFKKLLNGNLTKTQYLNVVIGLSRSLNYQNKALEAKSYLENLRSTGAIDNFGASMIKNLDLTLAMSLQNLGEYTKAEALLLGISKKNKENEEGLYLATGFNAIDLALARLWQFMGKYHQAEKLLLAVSGKREGDSEDELCHPCGVNDIDLALARQWLAMGKHDMAEKLLLAMRGKRASAEELCHPCGTSDIDIDISIDLTLARLWQVMGKYHQAEKLLLAMSGRSEQTNAEKLCRPCGTKGIDLTLALHWQFMGKYHHAEKLLLAMSGKSEQASEEKLCRPCGAGDIDLALARLWQVMGKYHLAEKLLLAMSGKHEKASEKELCRPCGFKDIDLALVRLWEVMGKNDRAEKLLLAISGKSEKASDAELCRPCGFRDIDLSLARLWQVMGKYHQAEKLLLAMSGKREKASDAELCRPCGIRDIDLTLARLWQVMSKDHQAEKLLLAMSGKREKASDAELCRPCGIRDIDLSLARLWQVMGKYHQAEKLLLAMSGKSEQASAEDRCRPCGTRDIDLALARLWQVMGKYHQAEKLLLAMSGKHEKASEKELCRPCGFMDIDLALASLWATMGKDKTDRAEKLLQNILSISFSAEVQLCLAYIHAGNDGFEEELSNLPDNINKPLLWSFHHFTISCNKIVASETKESIKRSLELALQAANQAIKDHPHDAGGYSQTGHCLRMMGAEREEWTQCFDKADEMDRSRELRKDKIDYWRALEKEALDKRDAILGKP